MSPILALVLVLVLVFLMAAPVMAWWEASTTVNIQGPAARYRTPSARPARYNVESASPAPFSSAFAMKNPHLFVKAYQDL